MIMIASFFIICSMLVNVSAQADEVPTDSAIGNLTALLGEAEVRNFVDGVIEANPVPTRNVRSLVEHFDGGVLRRAGSYPLCAKCVEIYSTSTTNFFVQQVHRACQGPFHSTRARSFCIRLEDDIASLDQFFNGYLFHRSRARQLAIATCIEDGKCPARNAFSSFLNPIIPAQLVDLSQFSFCPYCAYDTFTDCSSDVLPKMESFAAESVERVCHGEYVRGDLQEFCEYYMLDKSFGRGLVTSYVDLFAFAAGYCARDRC
ncbi:hypothetical protein FOL47_010929 [Perkinsus chesapeaki]|uniref:Uncharacterized protein n=1 Tax=Perkinsus chesapeaki TaxID=330153 RepID=A0A7J6N1C0_PERCH|nr:hypothetical protein FOL47_010929 [Perkinsus chesapeaki]